MKWLLSYVRLFFFIKWNSHQNELEIEIFWHHRYWEHPPWLIRAVSLHPPCRRLNVSFGVKFMPVKKPRGGGRKWRSFMFLTNYFASRNFRAWTCFSWTSVLKYLTWAKLTVKLFTGWTYLKVLLEFANICCFQYDTLVFCLEMREFWKWWPKN